MPRLFFLFLFCFFIGTSMNAQSKESLKQMMEKAKKEISDDPDMDPKEKNQLLQMMNSKSVQNGEKVAEAHSAEIEQIMKQGEKLNGLPQRDVKRIASLPKQPLNKEQCQNYIQKLTSKLATQIAPEEKFTVQNIIQKTEYKPLAMSTAAVALWYDKDPEAALFLALKAAQPDRVLTLNNAGAMLNQLGYEEKAVPLLQYALTKEAANSNVLENLGRAYLGLGETRKAKTILLSCVHEAPKNPEANNMLGCLYEAEGDKASAEQYYSQSLKGGYNENAYDRLQELQPDFDLVTLIDTHHKAPEYFNQFKIQVPEECVNAYDVKKVEAEHEAFQKELQRLMNIYGKNEEAAKEQEENELKAMQNRIMNAVVNGKPVHASASPFLRLGSLMTMQLGLNYELRAGELKRRFQQEKDSLYKEYQQADNNLRTGGHATSQAECNLASTYQARAADVHALFKDRYRLLIYKYFDDMLYWASIYHPTPSGLDAVFYSIVDKYLKEMYELSTSTPFFTETECSQQEEKNQVGNELIDDGNRKPFCPVNITIPFLIGKISFGCTSITLSAGEGIKAKYKKDFSNGQSTISIGAGVTVEAGAISGDVDESIYVTFYGDNQPTDVGLKWDATGKVTVGSINSSAHSGYTMGMNSGWDFTAGAFGQDIHL